MVKYNYETRQLYLVPETLEQNEAQSRFISADILCKCSQCKAQLSKIRRNFGFKHFAEVTEQVKEFEKFIAPRLDSEGQIKQKPSDEDLKKEAMRELMAKFNIEVKNDR